MSMIANTEQTKNHVLFATDGIHGTDGESNRVRERAQGDGVHGTDGEQFGSDESIPMEQIKPRRIRSNYKQDSAPAFGGLFFRAAKLAGFGTDGAAVGRLPGGMPGEIPGHIPGVDFPGEAGMDAMPGGDTVAIDDEEYLTDGLRDTDTAAEAGEVVRLLRKSDARQGTSVLVAWASKLFGSKPTRQLRLETVAPQEHETSRNARTKAINEALLRWKEAERYFDMVPHNGPVDYATYQLEAARRQYVYLLNLERKQSKISQELGLSEQFDANRSQSRPMRDHMLRVPQDTLPQ